MADGLIRLFEEEIVGGYTDTATVIELTDVTDLVGETPVTLAIFRTNDGNAKQAFDAGNYEEWHLAAEGDINETTDEVTVTRGYNGTTAQTIAAGDTWKVYNYINPAMWDDKASLSETALQTFAGDIEATGLTNTPIDNSDIGQTSPGLTRSKFVRVTEDVIDISSNEDALAIAELGYVTFTTTADNYEISGIVNGVPGRMLIIFNASFEYNFIFKNNVTAAIGNRLLLKNDTDYTFPPRGGALFIYRPDFWRLISLS